MKVWLVLSEVGEYDDYAKEVELVTLSLERAVIEARAMLESKIRNHFAARRAMDSRPREQRLLSPEREERAVARIQESDTRVWLPSTTAEWARYWSSPHYVLEPWEVLDP